MDCSTDPSNRAVDAKKALRAEILARRRAMVAEVRDEANRTIQQWVIEEILTVPTIVAAYSPMATEPGGVDLPDVLRAAGHRVLLPVLRDDLDLDWAEHRGDLTVTARGPAEPPGPRLGVDAVSTVGAVIVPGVAADADGVRLGRGGGSYDRALARVPSGVPIALPLFDGEWPRDVAREPHDVPVTQVVTPSGRFAVGRGRPGGVS